MAEAQPAGIYALTSDQEELSGLSFITFRTIGVFLALPALGMPGVERRHLHVNLKDLEDCVHADRTGRRTRLKLA
ncbi:hypothetical protein CAP39_07910 [Sphingomonas sp. IBVSS1]|nr:hypothetical protein CAP39_07910 [Sphingomonas sp. IBVSS1]